MQSWAVDCDTRVFEPRKSQLNLANLLYSLTYIGVSYVNHFFKSSPPQRRQEQFCKSARTPPPSKICCHSPHSRHTQMVQKNSHTLFLSVISYFANNSVKIEFWDY